MQAPSFSLRNQDNRLVTLDSFAGKKLVLYFYPKADTPGCTAQACGLRDNIGLLRKNNVVVVGVSPDDAADLKKFVQKYDLPFPLLADPDTTVLKAYGVWGEKQFMGRRYMGVLRTTFLIDEKGMVLKRYDDVKPDAHADMILADIRSLDAEKSVSAHKKAAVVVKKKAVKSTKSAVARSVKKTSSKKKTISPTKNAKNLASSTKKSSQVTKTAKKKR